MKDEITFQSMAEELADTSRKSHKFAEKYLTDFLNKLGVKSIDFHDYITENYPSINCITYDGGSHPEYASNAYSEVHGFGINEKNELYLMIEETEEYTEDRIELTELFWFADSIHDIEDKLIEWYNSQKNRD